MKSFGPKTWIYPMPVLIIATYNEDGTPNAMNAAWGGTYDYNMITISLGKHRTTDNLERTKAFTVSFADEKHIEASDYLGIVSGDKVPDKVARAGLTVSKSENVNAPVINEYSMTLECVVTSFEDGTLIGEIKNVLVREDCLGEDGLPDLEKVAPITFDPVHAKYTSIGPAIASAFQVGNKIK